MVGFGLPGGSIPWTIANHSWDLEAQVARLKLGPRNPRPPFYAEGNQMERNKYNLAFVPFQTPRIKGKIAQLLEAEKFVLLCRSQPLVILPHCITGCLLYAFACVVQTVYWPLMHG